LESIYFFAKDALVTPEDQHRAMQYRFGWFANPVFGTGGYPQIMIDEIDARSFLEGRAFSRLPKMTDEEKSLIHGSADFFALNYYTSAYLTIDRSDRNLNDEPSWFTDCACKQSTDPSWKRGKNEWLYSVPDGLRSLLNWIKHEYKNPPLLITENGWCDDGEIEDENRIEYFNSHLLAVAKAINLDKCNVIGYTAWSLIDSFEWNTGYTVKFGLFGVNMTSLKKERIPKKSVGFWQRFLKNRSIRNE
jgi:beta-glucosidase/6-phospho-beta-glucosidase/beta-galactosidase